MPLCTIFTKWPAPPGPIHWQHGCPSSALAAMACIRGWISGQASGEPPGMSAGPSKAPSSPPLTPAPTYKMPESCSAAMRRWVSVYSVLPPSMSTSPADNKGRSCASTWSTAAPAGTIIQMRRGTCRLATSPGSDDAACARRPCVRTAKFSRRAASKSKPLTENPLRSRLSARFSPITPRPTRPMSMACMSFIVLNPLARRSRPSAQLL